MQEEDARLREARSYMRQVKLEAALEEAKNEEEKNKIYIDMVRKPIEYSHLSFKACFCCVEMIHEYHPSFVDQDRGGGGRTVRD